MELPAVEVLDFKYPFDKLVENIIHTFKFYHFDVPYEDVKHEVVAFLNEKIQINKITVNINCCKKMTNFNQKCFEKKIYRIITAKALDKMFLLSLYLYYMDSD